MQFQTVTMLNAVTVNDNGVATAAYTLAAGEAYAIAKALASGYATIRSYAASAKTGSPVATFNSLQWTIDGTNWVDMHNFTDVDITTTGEHVVGQITTKTFPYTATQIRGLFTETTLNSTNKVNGYTVSIACCF